jgi:hypothetical protein
MKTKMSITLACKKKPFCQLHPIEVVTLWKAFRYCKVELQLYISSNDISSENRGIFLLDAVKISQDTLKVKLLKSFTMSGEEHAYIISAGTCNPSKLNHKE